MTENLILFTITPVQKFITTARKTEDLWLGSYILSHLNATAIHQIYAKDGVSIIYPSIENVSPFEFWQGTDITLPSFPNLFLAMSEKLSINELTQTMQYIEAVVQCEFEKMTKYAVETFVETVDNETWDNTYADQLFKKQIKHFFELYWVVSSRSSEAYKNWYAQTGTRLASVKNCRAFHQVDESGRKCSLCGEREIFHNGKGDSMEWWHRFAQRRAKYCRGGEALCTVCLTKRLAGLYFGEKHEEIKALSFPSTSEVSTADSKLRIAYADDATNIYEEFIKSVKALRDTNDKQLEVNVDSVLKLKDALENRNIDGDWLFEESFSEQNLERYYGVSKKAQIEQKEAIDQCGRLRQKLIKKIGFDPSRYFAVIVLDGDGMGQTISQAEDWEAHTAISSKLNEYTTKVRQIVDGDYLGKLIYAGGDDVLALANLGDLLKILCRLRWDFPNLNGQENPASTASAGVCIAHCKVPLGEVLSRARVMERAAKSVDGKNALGIALLKHSGNISRTVFKWEYKVENAKHIDMITVSRNLVELIKKGEVSKRFMYAFRDVFTRLTDRDGLLELPGIIESELERLIRRATSEKVLSDAEIQQRIDKNVQDLTTMLANKLIKFDDFISFLEIINFIAREGKTDETVSETE
jgi:CRISPR-associated protein Cmr2